MYNFNTFSLLDSLSYYRTYITSDDVIYVYDNLLDMKIHCFNFYFED